MVVKSLMTCCVTSVTFCFGAALSSLMGACCGNDKPSTVAPGASSGRKRSVLLLVLAIAIALAFQYGVATYIVNVTFSNYVTNAWLDGCDIYETDALVERCAGQAGVYRATFSALVFFLLATIAVVCKRSANREAWPAKYTLFLFLVAGMCFVPNEPLFTSIYLNIAFLFLASIVGWGLLFHYFGGCSVNSTFITLTMILSIAVTVAQLTGNEGSLLASGLITAYATMLCYNAVSKNPNEECNPFLKTNDALSITIGIGLTVVSLGYIGWSATADTTLGADDDDEEEEVKEEDTKDTESGEKKVAGVVTNYDTMAGKESEEEEPDKHVPNTFSNNWKLNIALATVTCWVSMALTGFGSIQADGDVANPQIGEVNMWVIIGSQWCALLLYFWTLVAPRLFPDRDFS